MSLALVLTLLALGIGYTQAVSSASAVTLRWLRLGDLIGLSLLAPALLIAWLDPGDEARLRPIIGPAAALLAGFGVHLVAVQLGRRTVQRLVIGGVVAVVSLLSVARPWLSGAWLPWWNLAPFAPGTSDGDVTSGALISAAIMVSLLLSALLLGGYLMTMLLGHAYLTAGGEMTQRPFLRLTRVLFAGSIARAAWAIIGAILWWRALQGDGYDDPQIWNGTLIVVRFAVGLLVPLVMTWMAIECVKIRSNQSATGILYVASILVLIGELTALTLMADLALPF